MRRNRFGLVALITCWLLASALWSTSAAAATMGDRFRKVIADIETWCKRNKVGPYLDGSDPEYRSKVAATDCDILKLKPRDWRETKFTKLDSQPYPIPEDWLATPEGRFAHSIKLPPPHDKPKDVYKPRMSAAEYFQALCRAEAGDFIFRRVANVSGIARYRAPEVANDDLLRHLFATEGTASMALWHISVSVGDDIGSVLVQPKHGRYAFAETATLPTLIQKQNLPFRRFTRDPAHASGIAVNYRPDGSTYTVPNEVVESGVAQLTARYGFTWRGTTRPNDREMGIAGGELIILDLQTSEVLGFRRVFRATGVGRLGAWWLSAANCSQELATLPAEFIYQVLEPSK